MNKAGYVKFIYSIIIAVVLFLSACSGGGGGGTSSSGGIGGTGVARGITLGSIDAFSSIIVNGVEFSTNGATFTINGAPAIESNLEIGQVVRAEVDFSALTASRVDYAETVRGPVQAVDFVNRTMTVLNQTIFINDTTSFFNNVPFDAANFVENVTQVEISGVRTVAGEIVASYIRIRNGTTEYRVIGHVDNLNVAANTFDIFGPATRLTVNFAASNQGNLSNVLANGLVVEAIGPVAAFAGNTLTASDLEDGLELNAVVGDQAEVEGIITLFNSIADFEVNGQEVNGFAATIEFENGLPANVADLAANVKVEVEGTIDGFNVIQATRIIIKPDSFIRITANTDATDVAAQTITLLGETINVTPTTRFEDKSAIGLPQFGLGDIMTGDYIEMRGSFIGALLVATRIEREDPDTEVELQGIVDTFLVNTSVTILGNSLIVDAGTLYFDENDNAITAAAFFAAISVGSIVKAEWDPFGGLATAVDEFSIEEL